MMKFGTVFLFSHALEDSAGEILKSLENNDFSRYMVLLLCNESGKVELIPTSCFSQDYYRNHVYICFGAAEKTDVAQEILSGFYGSVYDETGGVDVYSYLTAEKS